MNDILKRFDNLFSNLEKHDMYRFWTVKVIRLIPIFFICGVIIAMYFYPGGNIHHPEQIGYSFTDNFLSDLGGVNARSGQANTISFIFFNLSMLTFALGGIGFLFVPRLFKEDSTSYFLALIGSVFFFFGSLFFAGVGLTPHDLYLEEHIFFALNGFRLLVPAAICYFFVLLRSPIKNSYSLLTFFFLVSTFAYVIFQIIGESPLLNPEAMSTQATMQKLITLIHLISIYSLSFAFSSQLKNLDIS